MSVFKNFLVAANKLRKDNKNVSTIQQDLLISLHQEVYLTIKCKYLLWGRFKVDGVLEREMVMVEDGFRIENVDTEQIFVFNASNVEKIVKHNNTINIILFKD